MKKVFLDSIPKKGSKFDWKNSVGCVVPFEYKNVSGEVRIVEYIKDGKKLVIEYNGKVFDDKPIAVESFKKCMIGRYIGLITSDFKVEIGTSFKDIKRDMVILEREYRNKGKKRLKYYKYHCNVCTYENHVEESSLLKGTGCTLCSGKDVVEGINDIATTDSWMIDLGVSKEDAKRYTKSSGKEITVKCPDCKKDKKIVLRNLYQYRSICCSCKDGVSYPEKFMISFLEQLGINYTRQKSIDNNATRYDFFVPDYNLIIETHGMQHYNGSFNHCGGRSLKDEQENDLYKKMLANMWGYNYIVIDCRYSKLEWIKDNILKSELTKYFEFKDIDWNMCSEFAVSNMNKIICDYWNTKQEHETTKTIAKKFNLSDVTIQTYLKNGTETGLCNYDPKEESRKGSSRSGKMSGKKVSVFNLNGDYIGTFVSATELERVSEKEIGTKLYQPNISAVILGKVKQHKGYTFKYVS